MANMTIEEAIQIFKEPGRINAHYSFCNAPDVMKRNADNQEALYIALQCMRIVQKLEESNQQEDAKEGDKL